MQADAAYTQLDDYRSYGLDRVEVAAGEMVFKSARAGAEPRVITRLTRRLDRFVLHSRLGELRVGDSFILDGDADARQVRCARRCDLAFIRTARVETHPGGYPDRGAPWWLAPDLAAEVIEEAEWRDDLDARVAEYLSFGVKLVWVIDVAAREVRVHSAATPMQALHEKDKLTAEPIIPGWAMEIDTVFGR